MDAETLQTLLEFTRETKLYGYFILAIIFIVLGWVPLCTGISILIRGKDK